MGMCAWTYYKPVQGPKACEGLLLPHMSSLESFVAEACLYTI